MAWDDRFQPPGPAEERAQAEWEQFLEDDEWTTELREQAEGIRDTAREDDEPYTGPEAAPDLLGEVKFQHGGTTFTENDYALTEAIDACPEEALKICREVLGASTRDG